MNTNSLIIVYFGALHCSDGKERASDGKEHSRDGGKLYVKPDYGNEVMPFGQAYLFPN